MFAFRNLSFRRKVVVLITATSGLTLLLACAAFVAYDALSFRGAMQRDLSTLAEVIGANSAAALAFDDSQSAEEYLAALRLRPHILSAGIYTPHGTVLAQYSRRGASPPRIPPRSGHDGSWVERGNLHLFRAIKADNEVIGTVYICSDMEEMYARLHRYLFLAGLIVLASVLVALLLSARLQRAVSRPVLDLARAARTVATSQDYSVRVEKVGNDELGVLTDDFNGMLAHLQERDIALSKIQMELERQVLELQDQVTQRKQAEEALRHSEEQLRQSQKMEAIGLLAGGVAHDFNNLLTVISGYSQIIMAAPEVNEAARNSAEVIKEASDRAADLTRQLLAFSRKQVLAPRVLDLSSVVAGLEKILRRLIGEHIELVFIPGSPSGSVQADPGQLEQVLMNLAVNARDAMPSGGRLTIETSVVELDPSDARECPEAAPGRHVLLAVGDTGCGMDEDTVSRIFEPFFTTKGIGKGTGLGLSTVYGIVKQSGGHISVTSVPNQGTTFRVYLPLVEGAGRSAGARVTVTEQLRGSETILLVEDEALVRRFARQTLESLGYSVLEASYGDEAIAHCERHSGPIHLMLTDVVMPQMNGREVYMRVAPLRPDMKVLYMSGYTDIGIVYEGKLDPDIEFIQKPFTHEALARRVRQALDGVRAR